MQNIDKKYLFDLTQKYDFIVIDRQVKDLYFSSLEDAYILDDAESSKRMECFDLICNDFIKRGIRRDSKILAIGGGATSDLAGFVAATILRGVEWDIVPTTLLSMIDASIGGKVGINTKNGKNLIGAFHAPQNIYFHYDFLKTLNQNDYKSGLGELVKYCFLDDDIFATIDRPIEDIILKCASFKQSIVDIDPKESGVRKKLNFGHTFGHSFEKNSTLSHGESVLLGIYWLLLLFSKDELAKLNKICKSLKLNLPEVKVDLNDFIETLKFDKKNQGSLVNFILKDSELSFETSEIKDKILKEDNAKLYFS